MTFGITVTFAYSPVSSDHSGGDGLSSSLHGAHRPVCDGLVEVAPLLERCGGRFADLVAEEPNPARIAALRAAETSGHPIGAGAFLDRLAAVTGRDPRPGERGQEACGGAGGRGARRRAADQHEAQKNSAACRSLKEASMALSPS